MLLHTSPERYSNEMIKINMRPASLLSENLEHQDYVGNYQ